MLSYYEFPKHSLKCLQNVVSSERLKLCEGAERINHVRGNNWLSQKPVSRNSDDDYCHYCYKLQEIHDSKTNQVMDVSHLKDLQSLNSNNLEVKQHSILLHRSSTMTLLPAYIELSGMVEKKNSFCLYWKIVLFTQCVLEKLPLIYYVNIRFIVVLLVNQVRGISQLSSNVCYVACDLCSDFFFLNLSLYLRGIYQKRIFNISKYW